MKSGSDQKPVDKIQEALIAAHREQEDFEFPASWRQQVMDSVRVAARSTPGTKRKLFETSRPRRILSLGAVAALASLIIWLTLANLDWYDPWITLRHAAAQDHGQRLLVEAGDPDTGLRHLRIAIVQGDQEVEVFSHTFKEGDGLAGVIGSGGQKVFKISLVVDPQVLKLREGAAIVVIMVRDLSWRNSFQGRLTTLKQDVVLNPPKPPVM